MGRNVALGANSSAWCCAHIDDLEGESALRSKGAKYVVWCQCEKGFCSLGYLKIYFFRVKILSLCYKCSLISASRRQLLYYFYFPLSLTHTGAPRPFVSVPNLRAHTNRRCRFHSSRPTVFLVDDTAAPANRLQRWDISDISRNLTFMGLVFLPHFA